MSAPVVFLVALAVSGTIGLLAVKGGMPSEAALILIVAWLVLALTVVLGWFAG